MLRPLEVTVDATLTVAGEERPMALVVPAGVTRWETLLPVLAQVTDAVVAASSEAVAREGKAVSCAKGCGACCRQLVPVSPAEARRLADLVDSLPVARRTEVLRRFEEARARLREAGLLDRLERTSEVKEGEGRGLGLAYFGLGIACPFLEDEACSIHPDRPLACREYLVTSSPARCAAPSAADVEMVPIGLHVSRALLAAEGGESAGRPPWVPLILAPAWADANPGGTARSTGPELLGRVLGRLVRPAAP